MAENLVTILLYLAIFSVVIVLGWGFYNLFTKGPANTSQRLMRARIVFQLAAIVIAILLVWLKFRS